MNPMFVAVAVTEQGSIAGHAGRALQWQVFTVEDDQINLAYTLHLEDHACLHEWHTAKSPERHPLHAVDVAIAGSGGEGVHRQLRQRDTVLVTTAEKDPLTAVRGYLDNSLPEGMPHDHSGCKSETHG